MVQFALGMPFHGHPPNPEFLTASAIGQISATAEQAGFGAVYFTEHPIPSRAWLESGGHDALDPFVGLAFAAAATTSIRLMTNLTPVPFRNPLLLAKAVATLDVLSGGRLTLGVGTGYLKSEFFALGVNFDERNALFDEAIEVLGLAWSGDVFDYEGIHFSVRDSIALPKPAQDPVPLWIGGNSKLSLRRVAEVGAGWLALPNPREYAKARRSAPLETAEDLAGLLDYLHTHRETVGRTDPVDVMYMTFEGGTPGSPDWNPERCRTSSAEMVGAGVTWLGWNAQGDSLGQVLEGIEEYGSEIAAQL